MAKSTKTTAKVEGTSIDALVKEGKALAAIWKQTNSLKDTLKATGFDVRLGKLLQQLKAQSPHDSGRINRQVLVAHGIYTIDRRRLSEALWFVENETTCRSFIETSGFKGNSLTALQAAMRKSDKAEPAKAETSNVGQSEGKASDADEPAASKPANKPMNRSEMLDTILKACKAYGHNPEDIANDILQHISKGNAKVKFNTKVSKPNSKAAKAA